MQLRILIPLACLLPLLAFAQNDPNRDLKVEVEPTLEERRHALIIGNDQYPSAALLNAGNDARSMELTLGELGFETLLVENAKLIDLDRAIRRFASRIRPNDVALIFYAGHGFQIEGENYIVPVDFSGEDPEAAKYTSYSANKLLDTLSSRNPKLLLVVLDACRNNPFTVTRSMGGGLASMGASGKGTFIALATAPGSTASDNPNGNNGLFTTALLKHMSKKGMGLTETFDEVKREVSILSGDAQRPWTNSDFAGKWYFAPPDDYLPEEIDPSTSLRLLDEARRMQKNQFLTEAATLYDRLAAREKNSPLGALAAQEAGYWRALLANWPAVGSQPKPAEIAPKLKAVWQRIPARAHVGLESANNFLVEGNVTEAAEILSQLRGADQDTAFRATEMLQELAKDFPEAAKVSAARFDTLPSDPLTLKPQSRFEELAAKLKAEKAAKLKAAAELPQVLVPLSGFKTTLPPPTQEGWTVRLESLTPPEEPAAEAEGAPATEAAGPAPTKKAANMILVDIQSNPPKATVTIDTPEPTICVTPCTLDLPAGMKNFTFNLAGHRPLSKAAEVSKAQPLILADLVAELGDVMIASTPAQAQIELNGKPMNLKTPAKVSLPPGDYALSFWDGDIRIKAPQKFTVADAQTLSLQIQAQ